MPNDSQTPRRRAWLLIPPVLIGVVVLIMAATGKNPPTKAPPQERARAVRVVEALAAPVTPRAVGYGTAEPATSLTVVSEVSGRIAYISDGFVRGGVMKSGETIVRIEDADYRLAADKARADILAIDAQIDELKLKGESLKAQLVLQQDTLRVAERELERQKDLAARNAGSQASVDVKERDTLARRLAVLELENQVKLLPAQIRALESSKAVKEAQLAQTLLDLERVEIKAPFDGRVSESSVEASQFVTAGAKLGVLDGVESVEIEAQFSAASLRSFGRIVQSQTSAADAGDDGPRHFDRLGERYGVKAIVTAELGASGLAGAPAPSWNADVLRVGESVDKETRSIGVIVAVRDPYGQARIGQRPALFKGMFLRVELYGAPVEGLILAPRSTLRAGPSGGMEVLIVDAEDRLQRREVTLIGTLGDAAVIRSGLQEGDRIVLTDIAGAVVGEKTAPIVDAAAAARLAHEADAPQEAEQ